MNLEKVLLAENKQIVSARQLLYIQEFEKHSDFINDDSLERIGLNANLKIGKSTKDSISKLLLETKKYDQQRVFHISQIKNICEKYYLRFLKAEYYKGTIDKDLPNKINNFEAIYQIKCDHQNTMICAPVENFELIPEPKDPLLFYKINDEYYFLIHKWGNDLNPLRRLMSIFSKPLPCVLLALVSTILISGLIYIHITRKELIATPLIIGGVVSLVFAIHLGVEEKGFWKKNRWNSEYY